MQEFCGGKLAVKILKMGDWIRKLRLEQDCIYERRLAGRNQQRARTLTASRRTDAPSNYAGQERRGEGTGLETAGLAVGEGLGGGVGGGAPCRMVAGGWGRQVGAGFGLVCQFSRAWGGVSSRERRQEHREDWRGGLWRASLASGRRVKQEDSSRGWVIQCEVFGEGRGSRKSRCSL